MAAQVFAYIVHKNGVADDTALELVSAARNIVPDASPIAIVTGSGAELDAVCNDLSASFAEVWKFDHEALAYPNAEAIRKLLLAVLPTDAVILVPHDTFGMDLSPGLAVKLDSVFVSDAAGFEGMDGSTLKVIRQEYSGQVSTHLTADISAGAVINVRPGVFPPDESKSAGGQVVDKSTEIGDLSVGRQFLEVVEAEAG
ncbi:MAG: electron transfer flavoprotein subunit alpha/FixB family protein, partial [Deltaproteobacteria bacterium]|nr:electron transfer flavoprotein subunit alpha/FixB family protein [Deltaproteobacteria bacterium]